MHHAQHVDPPAWIFVFVPLLWLGVSGLLALTSGWISLRRRFPDHADEPEVARFKGLSGSLGIVSLGGILTIATCASGLRLKLSPLFAVFQRPILVPWEVIGVTRRGRFLGASATLRFADRWPALVVDAEIADALWRSIPERWPEVGPPPERPSAASAWKRIAIAWPLVSVGVVTVALVAMRFANPQLDVSRFASLFEVDPIVPTKFRGLIFRFE
ncbi:MAG: hypothetical protein JST54_32505, partial [Deltaproteobacteria bacterium]|nr:hypothetical protein [Deltaproteobacteria bacterium]